ncbi:MAG TPA: hypothetical protein VFX02_10350 [Gammaproteobacteria bacterium]|nr:hypothetical protein [Gammaproteobacteria bacterium]
MLKYFRFRIPHIRGQLCRDAVLLASVLMQPAQAQSFELNTDDWVRPRNGAAIVGFEALRQTVEAWSAGGGSGIIEIRYPGGEEGGLWASELTDWLVAFGVPSQYIHAASGSARRDRIMLEVMEPAKRPPSE